jgi:hypothetical protein
VRACACDDDVPCAQFKVDPAAVMLRKGPAPAAAAPAAAAAPGRGVQAPPGAGLRAAPNTAPAQQGAVRLNVAPPAVGPQVRFMAFQRDQTIRVCVCCSRSSRVQRLRPPPWVDQVRAAL